MNEMARQLDVIDIGRLMELLPHRYPFLLIDRIIDIDGDKSGTGIKNVTINEPYFAGHFPGRPIMPGVLLVEGMAQTAGAMCLHARNVGSPKLVYFMTIESAKFRKPVVPGDTLHYRLRQIRYRTNVWKFSGEAWVGDSKVAEAVISALISD